MDPLPFLSLKFCAKLYLLVLDTGRFIVKASVGS